MMDGPFDRTASNSSYMGFFCDVRELRGLGVNHRSVLFDEPC